MDYIHLNEMEFYGYHGALREETVLGQRFRANVSLAVDLTEAGVTDDLQKTVNYAEVFDVCRSVVEGEPRKLIESVAEEIASSVMGRFAAQVKGIRVVLIKPDPPIRGHYASVSVDITRGQFV
ncbi:dihydroneopterin aldolase [Sporosarcina thermotolerans]|uniref:7,8-dihydroneopterin aldolase n=1 Tax=Sporosarcina thermotolerans TaxID=633404 RepID=A0AAW9ACF7_9BACL|nr:dihydroneopterin aldolase [Sporosarcina thermotolerans]MDW0118719.1 dihydroneopterin aldolase [Sporosarcina thermotolerans]WHT48639.1 dihydroneopterin aldolase [Sporosarcina thermotolerans]